FFGVSLIASLATAPLSLRADHFAIELQVKTSAGTGTVHAQTMALGAKAKARPVLEGAAGKTITVHWTLTCTDSNETFKDVVAHFFIIKEEKAGQPAVPKLDKNVEVESALTMDFKPGVKARGEQTFQIGKPGVYLVRLETIGAAASAGSNGHEHFASLDLVLK